MCIYKKIKINMRKVMVGAWNQNQPKILNILKKIMFFICFPQMCDKLPVIENKLYLK